MRKERDSKRIIVLGVVVKITTKHFSSKSGFNVQCVSIEFTNTTLNLKRRAPDVTKRRKQDLKVENKTKK